MSGMSTYDFTNLFGETLVSSSKGEKTERNTASSLNGKNILIYFSAHWCPPCRGFTPTLNEWYKNFKKAGGDFEMVFVSSDKDEKQFAEYHGEMDFLALPFSDRGRKDALSKKYKVKGIPSLIVVGPDGEVVTADGRDGVTEDPTGAKFPWKPPSFSELFPSALIGKDGGDVAAASLDSKYLMIYFSAHWCGPCRGFTPELTKVYNELKSTRSDVELVFASSDKDQASFDEYYGEMPWLAIPFSNRDAKEGLSKHFGVEGIPSLVVLSPKDAGGNRSVINASARGSCSMDNVADFPWSPKPYSDLSQTAECNGSDINEAPAIIVLCENEDDDEQKDIVAAVKAVATKQPKGSELLFFYGCSTGGIVERIRQLCKLDGNNKGDTFMIKIDIPDEGAFYVSKEKDINADSIEAFMKDSGNRQQLG